MYFAYGWPKVALTDLPAGDTYVYLHATEKYLFAVSRTCVQLWTGGLHRIKLSECIRNEEDVKQEGWHMAALWSPAKATLAILTSENYLHLYAIHSWKDTLLHPSCNSAAKDIQKVDIYLRNSIRMESEARALSLTGDSRLLLVGFADGTVASLSWNGKMREVAYPLDDATDFYDDFFAAEDEPSPSPRMPPYRPAGAQQHSSGGLSPLPESQPWQDTLPPPYLTPDFLPADSITSQSGNPPPPATTPAGGNSFASLGPGPGASGGSSSNSLFAPAAASAAALSQPPPGRAYSGIPPSELSRAIVQMSYCEASKQVVMVLADGACAVCSTAEGGLSPLPELCFGRWLCGPAQQAVYAQVCARAQLIAVGRENGEVELFRLHRTANGSPGGPDSHPGGFPGSGGSGGASGGAAGAALEPPVRTLSLESWGHKVQQTGPVAQIEWSPDGRALAVGYAGQGVVVWSPSGCRLMCSLRQPPPGALSAFPSLASRGLSAQPSLARRSMNAPEHSSRSLLLPRTPASTLGGAPPGPPPQVPLDGGVSALCWGPMGYQLSVAEVGGGGGLGLGAGGGGGLVEVVFAHSLPGQHRVARGGLGSGAADEE
ncbi:hypothetical protein Agub_g8531, partial [Astrephomene gubernaculifera]